MTFEEAAEKAIEFRNARDWKQFHTPKDLALSIAIEAGELLEVFQWSGTDTEVSAKKECAIDELADIVIYCMYLADSLSVDLADAVNNKIDVNSQKYPVEKARGSSKKYTEL